MAAREKRAASVTVFAIESERNCLFDAKLNCATLRRRQVAVVVGQDPAASGARATRRSCC